MARNSRTPKNLNIIAQVIRRTGDENAARLSINVSPKTFNAWKASDPNLVRVINDAMEIYQATRTEEQIALAKQRDAEYLTKGHIITHVEETVRVTEDGEGNIVRVDRITTRKTENRGTPPAVLERILGQRTPLEQVIRTLVEEDIVPVDRLERLQTVLAELRQQSFEILFKEMAQIEGK